MERELMPPRALIYLKATGKDKQDDETKIAIFFTVSGEDVFETFDLTVEPEESFDHFLMEVKKQAKLCEFSDQEDRIIRDRLVIGTNDTALQERLLRESDLTLTKAVNQCRGAEAGKTQVKRLQERNVEVHEFQKAKGKQGNQEKKANR
ncbi:hypothetical protein ILUMI_04458 [Ignelater luminosus]|uniref:Uncharacterized protein n=1 Tax=Ignelater luminosus TaxID=2038154 RepID=A0A8K0D8Y6_IGNLU|nr:hypothetical protein ILUMI_04458 [Ignelater luminosus]